MFKPGDIVLIQWWQSAYSQAEGEEISKDPYGMILKESDERAYPLSATQYDIKLLKTGRITKILGAHLSLEQKANGEP
jgi:hypothetical protein